MFRNGNKRFGYRVIKNIEYKNKQVVADIRYSTNDLRDKLFFMVIAYFVDEQGGFDSILTDEDEQELFADIFAVGYGNPASDEILQKYFGNQVADWF